VPGRCRDLGDTRPHGAGADYADRTRLWQRRPPSHCVPFIFLPMPRFKGVGSPS
jgi:hypothetical protein